MEAYCNRKGREMNMPNVPIKDFCINGTCEKLEQLQAENEKMREMLCEAYCPVCGHAGKKPVHCGWCDKKEALVLATNTPQPPQNRLSE